jgi:hypothetical protein
LWNILLTERATDCALRVLHGVLKMDSEMDGVVLHRLNECLAALLTQSVILQNGKGGVGIWHATFLNRRKEGIHGMHPDPGQRGRACAQRVVAAHLVHVGNQGDKLPGGNIAERRRTVTKGAWKSPSGCTEIHGLLGIPRAMQRL